MTKLKATKVVCLILFVTAIACGQEKPKTPGLEIGKKAPDFELKDQAGKSLKLSEMLKSSPVAVIFHRSASW